MLGNGGSRRLPNLGLCLLLLVLPAAGRRVAAEEERVRFLRLAEEQGMRRYVSGCWGIVGVDIANPTDRPVQVLAATTLRGGSRVQYARELRIPPGAIRRSWTPIRLPDVPHGANLIQCESLLLLRRDGREIPVRSPGRGLKNYSFLRMDHSPLVTGIVSPDAWEKPRDGIDYAYEAVIALRTAVSLDRRTAIISDRYLPALPESLDGLDQLVLMDDRFAESMGGLSAIRGWLNQGGCLWIMLDRVDFDGVARLLGEAFACEYIGRVELNQVDIRPVRPRLTAVYQPPRRFEEPVPLVRVAVAGMEVTHRIDGWPAAFRRGVGQGHVVFTTVGAPAWIRRHAAWEDPWNADFMTDFEPTGELMDLEIMRGRSRVRFPAEAAVPYLEEQIGYTIPSRGPILLLLNSFAALLLLSALALARSGRLAWMGWIAPTLAVSAALPLIWVGSRAQRAVPPTLGQLQLIAVSESGNHATACGVLGAYHPDGSRGEIGADEGGLFESRSANRRAALRRMVWSDFDRWRMERSRLPSGVHLLPFSRSFDLTRHVAAVGTLDERGLRVHVDGLPELSDAIVAAPGQPRMVLRRAGDVYRASRDAILAEGRYLAEGWVNEEQDRRQAVYRALLDDDRQIRHWVTGLTLLGWSEPEELHFDFPRLTTRVGATLWKLPLTLERPAPGSRIRIPSPLLICRSSSGPAAGGTSPLYENSTGTWIQSNQPGRIWLRFALPPELLPLTVERALLTVDLAAPDRTLELLRGGADGHTEVLLTRANPLGRYELLLDDAPHLADPEGNLLVGISVGPMVHRSTREAVSVWKINSVQLDVTARVPETRPMAGNQGRP